MDDLSSIEIAEFQETFSHVPTPVAIVAAMRGDQPVGTTVAAFCSLSADPPLVLVALDLASNTLAVIRDTKRFSLNVLSAHQAPIARACATKNPNKFDGLNWQLVSGVPQLADVTSWLNCELSDDVLGGDHAILAGLIRATETNDYAPLVYHRRSFGAPMIF